MNCKPGDLAYVVGPGNPLLTDWIGRIVEVVGWVAENSAWEISFIGIVPVSACGNYQCIVKDSSLRPINGIPVDDEAIVDMPEAFEIVTGMRSKEWI